MKLIYGGLLGGYAVRVHGPEATGQFVIVAGKRVYFDFDERFGPLIVDPLGEPMKRQPTRENDPFWAPFEVWLKGYWTAKGAKALDAYLEAHTGAQPRVPTSHGSRHKRRAAPEGCAIKPAADGEVSKAAQPLQTTEPESDHCQTSGGEA